MKLQKLVNFQKARTKMKFELNDSRKNDVLEFLFSVFILFISVYFIYNFIFKFQNSKIALVPFA